MSNQTPDIRVEFDANGRQDLMELYAKNTFGPN